MRAILHWLFAVMSLKLNIRVAHRHGSNPLQVTGLLVYRYIFCNLVVNQLLFRKCALTSLPAPGRNAAFFGAFRRMWRSQIFCVQASRLPLRLEGNNQWTAVFTSCKERLNFLHCFRHCRTVAFATDLATILIIILIIIFICRGCNTHSAACKSRQKDWDPRRLARR